MGRDDSREAGIVGILQRQAATGSSCLVLIDSLETVPKGEMEMNETGRCPRESPAAGKVKWMDTEAKRRTECEPFRRGGNGWQK